MNEAGMMTPKVTVLDEFIIKRQKDFPFASGDLSRLLHDIGLAAKIINREVNKAGLVDILGMTGDSNVHGEEVKKLDIYANEELLSALRHGGMCCGIASEENEDFVVLNEPFARDAKYIVIMDPLDGSSNIDVNVSIGTIFSIYRRVTEEGLVEEQDFLQKGLHQVAAGYVIYGSSTMLVYTTGFGVNGFTLDPSIGEFCLSHPNIRIPEMGMTYSVNQGYYSKFEAGVQRYIHYCQGEGQRGKKPYSLRYIGSFVADFHRNLINGGIFMYPATTGSPKGKLRLLYECNPLAMIAEQAGGMATDGKTRILELQPGRLHERTPVFVGSAGMVSKVMKMIAEERKGPQ